MADEIADRLIVALDVPAVRDAEELAEKLDGTVSFFKIGFGLLFAPGTGRLIDALVGSGKSVFLDCKMYDIGETVKRGVACARERGVRFLTVHGDPATMQAAVAGKGRSDYLKILAVTILTSLDDAQLREMGYASGLEELIALRARSAAAAGVDGLIASARDHPDRLRELCGNPRLLVATPGIRPKGHGADDHKRSATPAAAVLSGADYLVVGRPVIAAPDPAQAARAIIAEMRAAAGERTRILGLAQKPRQGLRP